MSAVFRLRALGAQWYGADLPLAELRRAVPHAYWRERHWRKYVPGSAPPRTVAEFAARADVPDSFDGDRTPDPLRSHRPILLSTDEHGPLRISSTTGFPARALLFVLERP